MNNTDFRELPGCWTNDGGTTSGKIRETVTLPAGTVIFVFQNRKREGKNDPDIRIKFKLPDTAAPAARREEARIADSPPRPPKPPPATQPESADDLPF